MDSNMSHSRTPAFLSTFAPTNSIQRLGKNAIGRSKFPAYRCWERQTIRRVQGISMGTSMPEIPEVNLPEPAMPKQGDIAPELGAETAVVTVADIEETGNQKEVADVEVMKKQVSGAAMEDTWLDSILSSRTGLSETNPLNYLRTTSEAAITGCAFPTRKQESWRFTDLRSIYASRYIPAQSIEINFDNIDFEKYIPVDRNNADAILVFVNGEYNKQLSFISEEGNAFRFVGPVSEYEGDVNQLLFFWNRSELGDDEKIGGGYFPGVGNAISADAAVIDVAPEADIEKPIVICYLSTNGSSSMNATASAPRTALFASPNSSCTVYECFISIPHNELTHSSSAITAEAEVNRGNLGTCATILSGTTMNLDTGAKVKHFYVNVSSDQSSLIGSSHATLQDNAQYDLRVIGMGGMVGRLTAGIDLEGKSSKASAEGILITDGYRTQDLHSRVRHNNTNTTFDQVQKNISSDHGRAVFCGRIIVTESCLQTESNQLSQSLILSEKASVDAMPVLEIANDDVTCTHGATVSDLSDDELFYCRSRGLSHADAQSLLIMGFAKDILSDFDSEKLIDLIFDKVKLISEENKARSTDEAVYMSV